MNENYMEENKEDVSIIDYDSGNDDGILLTKRSLAPNHIHYSQSKQGHTARTETRRNE